MTLNRLSGIIENIYFYHHWLLISILNPILLDFTVITAIQRKTISGTFRQYCYNIRFHVVKVKEKEWEILRKVMITTQDVNS